MSDKRSHSLRIGTIGTEVMLNRQTDSNIPTVVSPIATKPAPRCELIRTLRNPIKGSNRISVMRAVSSGSSMNAG